MIYKFVIFMIFTRRRGTTNKGDDDDDAGACMPSAPETGTELATSGRRGMRWVHRVQPLTAIVPQFPVRPLRSLRVNLHEDSCISGISPIPRTSGSVPISSNREQCVNGTEQLRATYKHGIMSSLASHTHTRRNSFIHCLCTSIEPLVTKVS